MEKVDTVVMGRRTYDKVMSMGIPFPHADRSCYVITRTPRAAIGRTIFHTGDPAALIRELRAKPGGIIFVDGGAQVVNRLLQERLIDGITLSIIPVLLGDGIRLFSEGIDAGPGAPGPSRLSLGTGTAPLPDQTGQLMRLPAPA